MKIRANLERQIQVLERASERLLSVAGPRFEVKVKRDGQFCTIPLRQFTATYGGRQTLFPHTSKTCTLK